MLSTNLVVFDDTHLAQLSSTCNFYLCAFAYVVAFWYAFVFTSGKLRKLRIEHVDLLPAELADLRRGTDEVVTQLYDEVTRVRAGNTDVFRELKEEINDLHADDDKFVVELREHFTRVTQKNEAVENLVTAAIVRTRTLEAELNLLPGQFEGLRRGIHEVVTQLHDEVARVQGANSEVHRELRRELIERHQGNGKIVAELREHVTKLTEQNEKTMQQLYVLSEETVRSLRFTVTQLNQKNDDAVSNIQTLDVKMRALEAELDTQRQKHVELSDFARRAYIPPHAAVVAAAAKEERTRGNAAVMAEVVRLSRDFTACNVNALNEVVIVNHSIMEEPNYFGGGRHSSVATVHPSLYHQVVSHNEFEKCPTCLIGAALKFFAFYGWQEYFDDALNFICGIADCPREAFVLYCLFLNRFGLRRSGPEAYTFAYLISGINLGLNHQNFHYHRESRSAVDQKVQDVFKYLAFKLNPPHGVGDVSLNPENTRLLRAEQPINFIK